MSEQDRFVPGVPSWVDLTTPQLQVAQDFYGGLFGWTFDDAGAAPGGGRYLLAQLDGSAVGGLMQGERGGWNSYVLVDSVHASGGGHHRPCPLVQPPAAAGCVRRS